jgi:hypothetical protein
MRELGCTAFGTCTCRLELHPEQLRAAKVFHDPTVGAPDMQRVVDSRHASAGVPTKGQVLQHAVLHCAATWGAQPTDVPLQVVHATTYCGQRTPDSTAAFPLHSAHTACNMLVSYLHTKWEWPCTKWEWL